MNRCIILSEPGKVELREIKMPIPKKNEALLKVLYGGICGSDLNSYKGSFAYTAYPLIPGHEFSAQIEEIDTNQYGFEKGMIVTCNPYFNCTECYSCTRGYVNCCEKNQTMGVQRDGAFAQYITMPIERICNGNGLPPRALALIEPLCISLHGVKRAAPKPKEKVLIMGAGTIGTLAALVMAQYGADVTICDISSKKLKLAQSFGIDHQILNNNPQELEYQKNLLTDGKGFDITIEAVGLPSTFQDCIDSVAYRGRVVLIGVGKMNLDFCFTLIQKKELSVFGSRNAMKSDFEQAINIVKAKELPIDIESIITHEFFFEDAQKAFENNNTNAEEVLKLMLRF